tara:strand:- start:409 stop:990 length:582 start_codon:yes stop_codon:yes gene_type:complete
MPGHYAKNNFDLAGFSVGVVEKAGLIDGKEIKPGNILLGVESSGPHSNGYSLIRSILKKHKAPDSIMRALLKPTHLYAAPILELIKKNNVKGMAHITGGGLTENIPRILKNGLIAKVNLSSWKFPKAFQWLQEKGEISESDMLRIFNCGIGMVCILDKAEVPKAKNILSTHKLRTFEIGSIIKGNLKEQIQYN